MESEMVRTWVTNWATGHGWGGRGLAGCWGWLRLAADLLADAVGLVWAGRGGRGLAGDLLAAHVSGWNGRVMVGGGAPRWRVGLVWAGDGWRRHLLAVCWVGVVRAMSGRCRFRCAMGVVIGVEWRRGVGERSNAFENRIG